MRHRPQRSALALVLVGILMAVAVTPSLARAPEPLVFVNPPTEDEPESTDEMDETESTGQEESGGEDDPVDESEPQGPSIEPGAPLLDCTYTPASSVQSGAATPQGPSTRAAAIAFPGPVVAVDRQCWHDISIRLVINAPERHRPVGLGAWSGEAPVSQAALEAGYQTTQPAADRAIALMPLPPTFEFTGARCTCGLALVSPASATIPSGPAGIQLTAYPGPVVAISPSTSAPTLSGSCLGPLPEASAARSIESPPISQTQLPDSRLTTAPRPVVAIGPPPQQPATVSWSNGQISIDDPAGNGVTVSCDWTIELVKGHLTIETTTDPPGAEDRVAYRVTPRFDHPGAQQATMSGAANGAMETIRHGTWDVEARIPHGWDLVSSTCSETEPELVSFADGATAQAGIDPGDDVRCTFSIKALTPLPGRWRSVSGAASFSCVGNRLSVPKLVQNGTLGLARGGDRIVGRGLLGGNSAVSLDRNSENPRRFGGTTRLRAGGGEFVIKVDLRLVSPRRMKGTLRGKATVQGVTCSLRRAVDLKRLGN